ncbi:MAG: VIT domain-containing protein, partial [Alphaproteobacteria bacterium]
MKPTKESKVKSIVTIIAAAFILSNVAVKTQAAGLLKPISGGGNDVKIKSHKVNVTINNGFAKTEVDQIFENTGDRDLDAIYSFPVPKKASLSELSLWINGSEVIGEVLEKEKAKNVHNQQKSKGKDTALAEKNDFKTFQVSVSPVRAGKETRIRLVYYQPLEIDLGVGRYLYPLAEGGVDEEQIAFWSVDDEVTENFSFNLKLKSAFPVADVRLPHYDSQASITKNIVSNENIYVGDIYDVTLNSGEEGGGARLSSDIVFYYRLAKDVPARVELVPYKTDKNSDGTFMAVVTPGASLKRISEGTDWTFVLDVSGSMNGGKITTLVNGVAKVIGKMSPNDRFRIITFESSAK